MTVERLRAESVDSAAARPQLAPIMVEGDPIRAVLGSVLDEAATPVEEPDTLIGPVPTRREAREWALVLQSMDILSTVRFVGDGWVLEVAPEMHEPALSAIEKYETENENWPPPKVRDRPRYAPSMVLPLAFVSLALFYALVTGPVSARSIWFVKGTADAQLLLAEPWRMLTALTLHADAKHVIGNAISGSIFGTAVARRLGPGGGLLAILGAGIAGNTANAVYHLADGHRSIGASTAVFGAVGLLATMQVVIQHHRRKQEKRKQRRFLELAGPVIGGLALLGALGASPQSDLGAHGFGFAAGALMGLVVGLIERRREGRAASWPWQVVWGAVALAAIGGCWQLALRLG